MSLLWVRTASLDPFAAHPNLYPYRSGGIGHLPGDESRSTVGMVPLHALEPLRDHDGIQNPDHPGRDRKIIDGIRSDLRSGHGLEEPLQVFHDPITHRGWIGEGNHRLRALVEEGHTHAPVRVHSRSRVEEDKGAPLRLSTQWKGGIGEDYTPPEIHPHHFHELRP